MGSDVLYQKSNGFGGGTVDSAVVTVGNVVCSSEESSVDTGALDFAYWAVVVMMMIFRLVVIVVADGAKGCIVQPWTAAVQNQQQQRRSHTETLLL